MPPRTPVLAGLGIVVVVLLAFLVAVDATDPIDRAIFDAIRAPGPGSPLAILGPITELGSTLGVTIVAVLALALGVAAGPWRHGVLAAAVIGLASLGVEIVKAVVARERPDVLEPILVERGFSFPSGHATLSMTAYGILAVLVSRSRVSSRLKTAAGVLVGLVVLAVGTSRIWLGVHFPSDVLAGWTAGAVIVLLFADLTRGVSTEPVAAAAAEDRGVPRSGPPAAG